MLVDDLLAKLCRSGAFDIYKCTASRNNGASVSSSNDAITNGSGTKVGVESKAGHFRTITREITRTIRGALFCSGNFLAMFFTCDD